MDQKETMPTKSARPRNAEETRADLLAAARLRFARDGFDATNLRDIAADVGVNVALIPRYFGSKEGLFQAVVAFDRSRLAQAMQGPPEHLAERLLKNALGDPAGRDHDLFVTLLRSSDYPPAASYMRTLLDLLSADLATQTTASDAELRADLVVALITGIVVLRRLVGKTSLSEATTEALLPSFQHVLSVLLPDVGAGDLSNK
ncbi:TetR family transcriptional regulator [Reticulibacter mediterranei]|uniref:TetR family transcriptional regulator n=1 Tax=Reticulibacter mediterranei TaxID=2778369 RepID=A0A8J3IHD0_9CHLR|nr:TetR family transcriptional regulator [Reticulibacter mediterranei]GHO90765.1 TetR family transcriptional regulator [Reticulibacter mediterranei]